MTSREGSMFICDKIEIEEDDGQNTKPSSSFYHLPKTPTGKHVCLELGKNTILYNMETGKSYSISLWIGTDQTGKVEMETICKLNHEITDLEITEAISMTVALLIEDPRNEGGHNAS
jgi:hypothetical protein